ncbi:MAG: hypothetical protein LUD55_04320 [Oscillospiraceae bacterium]|nr:hypothetical protein [Oscillospiraceae bacterium]
MKGYKITSHSNARQPPMTKEQNMRDRYLRTFANKNTDEQRKAIGLKSNALFPQTKSYKGKPL